MVTRFTLCDTSKLKLALAGELPEAALGDLSRHLQSCPHCREELESLSGGERWAGDARHYLSSSDELVAVQEMTPPAGVPSVSTPNFPAADHPVDLPDDVLDLLSPTADDSKLGRLGNYEIESIIGRGGFGIVLKAFDPALNRYVAIKALSGGLVRSSAARKRFHHEAKAAAGVVHDHVIPIHHIETSGPVPYLVMPLITGRSLQERIDEHGPLEIKEVLRIARQTAQGLAAAHAQGLVHRDIKPANILLENGVERVQITDFGLARAVDDASQTQSGYIAGTPQYMAPEQARGESIDSRADLFSLGSVIYAMCTGRPPFRAETTLAVLRRICDDEPRPPHEINPDVPSWLAAIAQKLLAKNPTERFQSANEVAELLGKWLAHLQQPTVIPPPVIAVEQQRRRPNYPTRFIVASAAWLAAGMLLASAAIWLPGLLVNEVPPRPPPNGATEFNDRNSTSRPEPIAPAELAAAARADREQATAIETELSQVQSQLQQMEAALTPHSDSGWPIEEAELRAAIERLEWEVNRHESPRRSPQSE